MKKIVWLLLVALVVSFAAFAVAECDHLWDAWAADQAAGIQIRFCLKCGAMETKPLTPGVTTEPTAAPTAEPTVAPTAEPTVAPTAEPTVAPTAEPTVAPTVKPTEEPEEDVCVWSDWTVIKAATCLEEGKEIRICTTHGNKEERAIPKAAHNYGEWHVSVKPTCDKDGLNVAMCTVPGCGDVKKEVVPAAHTYGAWNVQKAATCSAEGVKVRMCTVEGCGNVEKGTIAKLAHTEVAIPAVPATCTETGLTEGKQCSVCGEITVPQKTTELAAHTEVEIPAVAATCTETGLTAGKKCSVCDKVTVEQKATELAPHTEVEIPAVAATCTETGLTAGKKCSVCGKVTVAQKEVAAKGHTEAEIPAVAPTCEETGLTAGKKCSVCNAVLVAQTEIKAIGHKYVVKVIAPTTTSRGYTANRCKNCGNFYRSNYVDKLAAEVTVDYLTGIVFDAEVNPVAYTATATVDAEKVLTVKADAAEKNTVRILSLTFDQVELLKADGVKTIVFVVGEHELVIPMDVFAQEMLVVARNYLGEAALGYNFTVACGDAACTMKVEIKTAGDPTDVTAIVTGVELK